MSTSLYQNRIYVAWPYLYICLCFSSLASGIFILKLGHRGSGVSTSWIISTLDFHCLCMKCLRSLTGLCALAGIPSTGHATYVITRGNDTTYVSNPPPPTSTPWVCVMNFLWVLSMWGRSDDHTIISTFYSIFFHSGSHIWCTCTCSYD